MGKQSVAKGADWRLSSFSDRSFKNQERNSVVESQKSLRTLVSVNFTDTYGNSIKKKGNFPQRYLRIFLNDFCKKEQLGREITISDKRLLCIALKMQSAAFE